jgi:hypothetical protein
MHQTKSSSRTDAPVTALTSPKISYYPDHVTIRLRNGVWTEALQEQAQSANIRPDPRAVADLIASERSQPVANRSAAIGARPVLHSDPRDAIPLTYCDRTRRIISLVGFVVSSATILGVHMAGNDGRVPGFQPLKIFQEDYDDLIAFICGGVGGICVITLYAWLFKMRLNSGDVCAPEGRRIK